MHDEIVATADAVVVRPGDTLIIRVRSGLTREQFNQAVDAIKSRLADDVHVLAMDVEQLLVYRPDGGEH